MWFAHVIFSLFSLFLFRALRVKFDNEIDVRKAAIAIAIAIYAICDENVFKMDALH